MSSFENTACKVMAIMLVILLGVLSLQLMGCSYNTPKYSHSPYQNKNYPIVDTRDILHKYRDNFDKIIFPRNNQLLTRYCGAHFQWENIKAVWKCEEDGNYKWYYTISESKKQ